MVLGIPKQNLSLNFNVIAIPVINNNKTKNYEKRFLLTLQKILSIQIESTNFLPLSIPPKHPHAIQPPAPQSQPLNPPKPINPPTGFLKSTLINIPNPLNTY